MLDKTSATSPTATNRPMLMILITDRPLSIAMRVALLAPDSTPAQTQGNACVLDTQLLYQYWLLDRLLRLCLSRTVCGERSPAMPLGKVPRPDPAAAEDDQVDRDRRRQTD